MNLNPDVLLAGNNPTAAALQQATRTIPIVFLLADPVASGLVSNLARPGGNITGFIALEADTVGKQLELLKEIAPARIGANATTVATQKPSSRKIEKSSFMRSSPSPG